MKILFFISSLYMGGAERVLVNLSSEMSHRGHDVTISINEDIISYSLSNDIKVAVAPKVCAYIGNNPIKKIIWHIKRKRRNYLHTRNIIRFLSPDVIISFLQCNMISIICCHGKIPIIHSEHNAYDRRLGLKNYFNRFFLNRFFDKVCVLSPFDKGYATAKGLKNIVYMPNPNTFNCLNEIEYDELFPKRKNVLICGRVNAWFVKGFDIAIEAYSRIAHLFPNDDLDIAGYGDNNEIFRLTQLAEHFGVSGRVHFLGKRDDIHDVYRQHKFFLLSSRTEGFPMVITEAMSQGLPCVSFERLASSIIIDNVDGSLVPDGNIEGMVDSIKKMLSDVIRFSYGKEAIKNVNRFSSEHIAERWESLINDCL